MTAIENIIVYKVNIKDIFFGDKYPADGFYCRSIMFLDYEKAMNFAFDLARNKTIESRTFPYYCDKKYEIGDNNKTNDDEYDINKLLKSEIYRWPDNTYNWDAYSIHVLTEKLEFDKNIISETFFSSH